MCVCAGSFGALDPASHDLYMFLEKLQEQQREVVALIKARQDVIARRAAEAGNPPPLPLPPSTNPLRPASERASSPSTATTPSQASRFSPAAEAEAQAIAKKNALAAAANAPISPSPVSEGDARRRKALEAKQAGGVGAMWGSAGIIPGGQTAVLAMQTAVVRDTVVTQEAMQTSTTTGMQACHMTVHCLQPTCPYDDARSLQVSICTHMSCSTYIKHMHLFQPFLERGGRHGSVVYVHLVVSWHKGMHWLSHIEVGMSAVMVDEF